ncbi:TadE family protein [Bradyrhizobium sp. CCBAU 45384]|uniref:TadE family protein n=1 Tax=Bradyrhizobium sp. CCBAU 45384 TaxID=858428 RepID=UPI0023064BC7|nr:TadE/TadG family type IV pilus assembly protein [Bradyrhizobium sp. CCBAU 45384]
MRKLDQRGIGAMEFCLVALPLFLLMFTIFDLGRYAITMQSLRALANAGARTWMINDCYVNSALSRTTPTCTGDPLPSAAAKQAVAPMLFAGGLTPTLSTTSGASALTVTASDPGFSMIMPIWGTALNAPSASTTLPF